MSYLDKAESNELVIDQKLIPTVEIYVNSGQISGLPANPRYIEEAGYNALLTSLTEDPEYLVARPLIVIPYAGAYVAICGNMRLRASIELKFIEVPCIVLNPKTPIEKLKRYLVKDNIGYGKHDWDLLANSYELEELQHFGMELPSYITDPLTDDDSDAMPEVKAAALVIKVDCMGDAEAYDRLKLAIAELVRKMPNVEIK